jgi:hypothetical protein
MRAFLCPRHQGTLDFEESFGVFSSLGWRLGAGKVASWKAENLGNWRGRGEIINAVHTMRRDGHTGLSLSEPCEVI